MVSALQERHSSTPNQVHQPVCLRNAARPHSGSHMPQWFRFPGAEKWIAADFLDEFQDAQRDFSIG